MHNPWKVRLILFGGLALVGLTIAAPNPIAVVFLLASACAMFIWGLREAAHDPYELRELSMLEERYKHLSPTAEVTCPHCMEVYPSKRSVCPHCMRSP